MNLLRRIALTIIALVGFCTSIKLAFIYFDANFNPYALSSFCSVNDLIDCDGVAKTSHSQFLGVPLALWGIFLYFVFLFFTYVDKIKNIKIRDFRIFAYFDVFQNPLCYISALGLLAFLISMTLAGISIFEINKICILCFFTYVLNLLIAIIAKPSDTSYFETIKTSITDFVSAIRVKKYAIAFSILAIIAVGILAYTEKSSILAPHVKQEKELKAFAKQNKSKLQSSGNIIGDKNATLTVYEYTDYQCPFCFVLNTMTLRAVSELSNVKFVHINLPLDAECNPKLKQSMHPGSCEMAKFAIAAGLQDKYWEMNNMLFDKEYKSREEILKDAKKLGLNIEKLQADFDSEYVNNKLKKDINDGNSIGIDGTPAFRINLETHVGIVPYEEFKEKLIKAGAKERK